MRRLIIIFAAVLLCTNLSAQCYVYETTGDVLVEVDGAWKSAYKTMSVKPSNLIKTEQYSSVVILDRGNNKLYTFQSPTPVSLESLIKNQKTRTKTLIDEVAQELYFAMFKGNNKSKDISNYTSGVTYRDENVDRYIAQALASSQSNTDVVSLCVVDDLNGEVLSCARIGVLGVIEITNNSSENLYVNVLDFDSEGNISPIFPMDEYHTMTHLYIPANSVVRLRDYPVEFYEPLGVDTLVLVAYHKPFDIANVVKMLQSVTPQNAVDVYINSSTITIAR